ncbi:N-methylhydantoinase B [Rhodoblastus acidophilus]|uniref:hydantoinase B/oxoprolinase family protein n=1 Tax=Rhodoblastus acidophilus TaxID=1074 RepID=UPI002224447D|nr:hydantoinase B/oxoprolinase family protein [Rhodoblastus acidophilus]MCW2318662.1 N-methylhydantoinase B [Rhodoblastus acidophilus]
MDPVRTEVMRNRFAAIVAEASYVAYRCAHTTFVREVQDYQVSIAGLTGEYFAWPTDSGTSCPTAPSVMGLVEGIGRDKLRPGDVVICNDPFSGGAIVTHTMDIHLLTPIFHKDRLVAYGWAFIHASDVGGSVAGSVDPRNYEIFQEGLRISPTFLYREGRLNEQLWQIFKDNTRIPDLIWGDLQAMIAGMKLLETRMGEICDRYGVEETLQSIDDVLDLADQKAQQALRKLRNGTYVSHDYLETYDADGHIFIHCKLVVDDGKLTLDFEGSDPQVNYSMNFPSGDGAAHSHLGFLITQYIRSVEPNTPVNTGMLRSVRTFAPKGSIVNAEFPAAMGNRAITINRCYDAALACLNQAIEGGLSAAGAGTVGIISVASIDTETGRRRVGVIDPFLGGGGGRNGVDGVNGSHTGFGFLKSVPIETIELETPLIVRYFGYERDTAAAGEYRGGAAMRLDLENTGAPAIITCRGLDRVRFQPWGVQGGNCGGSARIVLNPGGEGEKDIGKIDVLQLLPGDLLRMVSPSGGGFGDPALRPVERVVADVVAGIISKAQALRDYGVATEGDGFTMRGERVAAPIRRAGAAAALGETRARLEAVWPADISAALASEMLKAPAALRTFWLDRIRRALNDRDRAITRDELHAALANLRIGA